MIPRPPPPPGGQSPRAPPPPHPSPPPPPTSSSASSFQSISGNPSSAPPPPRPPPSTSPRPPPPPITPPIASQSPSSLSGGPPPPPPPSSSTSSTQRGNSPLPPPPPRPPGQRGSSSSPTERHSPVPPPPPPGAAGGTPRPPPPPSSSAAPHPPPPAPTPVKKKSIAELLPPPPSSPSPSFISPSSSTDSPLAFDSPRPPPAPSSLLLHKSHPPLPPPPHPSSSSSSSSSTTASIGNTEIPRIQPNIGGAPPPPPPSSIAASTSARPQPPPLSRQQQQQQQESGGEEVEISEADDVQEELDHYEQAEKKQPLPPPLPPPPPHSAAPPPPPSTVTTQQPQPTRVSILSRRPSKLHQPLPPPPPLPSSSSPSLSQVGEGESVSNASEEGGGGGGGGGRKEGETPEPNLHKPHFIVPTRKSRFEALLTAEIENTNKRQSLLSTTPPPPSSSSTSTSGANNTTQRQSLLTTNPYSHDTAHSPLASTGGGGRHSSTVDPQHRGSVYATRNSIFSAKEDLVQNTFDWKRNSVFEIYDPSLRKSPNNNSSSNESSRPTTPGGGGATTTIPGEINNNNNAMTTNDSTGAPKGTFSSFSKLFPDIQSQSSPTSSTPGLTPSPMTMNGGYRFPEPDFTNKIKETLHEMKEQLTNQFQHFANYTMALEKQSSEEQLIHTLKYISDPKNLNHHHHHHSSKVGGGGGVANNNIPTTPKNSSVVKSPKALSSPVTSTSLASGPVSSSSPSKTPVTPKSSNVDTANNNNNSHNNIPTTNPLSWNDIRQILKLNNMVLQYNSNAMKEDSKVEASANSNSSSSSTTNLAGMTNTESLSSTIAPFSTSTVPSGASNNTSSSSPTNFKDEDIENNMSLKKQYLLKKIELELIKPKKLSQQRSLESALENLHQYTKQNEQLCLHYISIYDNFLSYFNEYSTEKIDNELQSLSNNFHENIYPSLKELLAAGNTKQKTHLLNVQKTIHENDRINNQKIISYFKENSNKNNKIMKEIADQYQNNSSNHHSHEVRNYYYSKLDTTLYDTYNKIYQNIENDSHFKRQQVQEEEIFALKRKIFNWKLKYKQSLEDRLQFMDIVMNGEYLKYVEELNLQLENLMKCRSLFHLYSEKLKYHLEDLIYKHENNKVTFDDFELLKHYKILGSSQNQWKTLGQQQQHLSPKNDQKTPQQQQQQQSNQQASANSLNSTNLNAKNSRETIKPTANETVKTKTNILSIGTHIRCLGILAGLSDEETSAIMCQLYDTARLKFDHEALNRVQKELENDETQEQNNSSSGILLPPLHPNRPGVPSRQQFHVTAIKKAHQQQPPARAPSPTPPPPSIQIPTKSTSKDDKGYGSQFPGLKPERRTSENPDLININQPKTLTPKLSMSHMDVSSNSNESKLKSSSLSPTSKLFNELFLSPSNSEKTAGQSTSKPTFFPEEKKTEAAHTIKYNTQEKVEQPTAILQTPESKSNSTSVIKASRSDSLTGESKSSLPPPPPALSPSSTSPLVSPKTKKKASFSKTITKISENSEISQERLETSSQESSSVSLKDRKNQLANLLAKKMQMI